VSGDITRHPSEIEDNFSQAGIFFRNVLSDPEKERLVDNMGSHLANAQKFIQVPKPYLKHFGLIISKITFLVVGGVVVSDETDRVWSEALFALTCCSRILTVKLVYTTYFVLQ
jgi:catalase